jgi:MbtH protein
MDSDLENEPHFKVVISLEAQYSLWPDDKDIPAGWIYAGVRGTKTECLAYIEAVWTDMRPLHLRKLMDNGE